MVKTSTGKTLGSNSVAGEGLIDSILTPSQWLGNNKGFMGLDTTWGDGHNNGDVYGAEGHRMVSEMYGDTAVKDMNLNDLARINYDEYVKKGLAMGYTPYTEGSNTSGLPAFNVKTEGQTPVGKGQLMSPAEAAKLREAGKFSGMDYAQMGLGLGQLGLGVASYFDQKKAMNDTIKNNNRTYDANMASTFGRKYDGDGKAIAGQYNDKTIQQQVAGSLARGFGG